MRHRSSGGIGGLDDRYEHGRGPSNLDNQSPWRLVRPGVSRRDRSEVSRTELITSGGDAECDPGQIVSTLYPFNMRLDPAMHWSVLTVLFASTASCASALQTPTAPPRIQAFEPGTVTVVADGVHDPLLEIEQLSARIDGHGAVPINWAGPSRSWHLDRGAHEIEVVGAFRRSDPLVIDPSPDSLFGIATHCTVQRCGGPWRTWRREAQRFDLREGCVGIIRVEVVDFPTPAGWSSDAPLLDIHIDTVCGAATIRPVT